MTHVGVALDHPANAQALARLRYRKPVDREKLLAKLEALPPKAMSPALTRALERLRAGEPDPPEPPRPPSQSPAEVDTLQLGTHPDIIDRLWGIGRRLPEDCAWVSFRQPVLAHARTGILFGIGVGTLGFGLRLPPDLSAAAQARGLSFTAGFRDLDGPQVFSLRDYGEDWWFGRWTPDDDVWARAAFDFFGAM
jgi:hypothetical protein